MIVEGFFRAPPAAGLIRPLSVSVIWTYAAALAAAVVVGVAGLVAVAVAAVSGFFNDSTAVSVAAEGTVSIAARVAGPAVVAIAVWVAAYGSTRQGSVPRALVAAPVAVATTVALYLLGSVGFFMGGLGIGWAIAVPAVSPTRVAARSLPLLIATLLLPGLEDLGVWVASLVLIVSPVVAAVGVLLGQVPWRNDRSTG